MARPASLPASRIDEVLRQLSQETAPRGESAARPKAARTPVHVVYGGAHLYRADAPAKLGKIAQAAMDTWGKDDGQFGTVVGLTDASLASELGGLVREKLAREPVEKMCIDFEDGYGPRSDDEEDGDAARTAEELARVVGGVGVSQPGGPTVGIRIKALTDASARRAIRTLDLFLTTLVDHTRATNRGVPDDFTVTLPKITRSVEVSALAELLESLEEKLGIPKSTIGVELMVETPRALVDDEGRLALASLVGAARGRCRSAHLGAYDLTASMGVTAGEQRLDHPACDMARLLMQLSLAGTGVDLVDGATTILPIARHRETAGHPLTDAQRAINAGDVQTAWSLHATSIRRALEFGIYQGWDLHPAQLPARYGAIYSFFLAERTEMTARLRSFVAQATQAMRSGRVFDDAATGQGLLAFFLRGAACGALSDDDVRATGLSMDELRSASFAAIVAARSKA